MIKRKDLLEKDWQQVCVYLSEVVPSNLYALWIKPLKPLRLENDQVIIGCPNPFIKQWVEEHFIHYLQEAWRRYRPECKKVVLKVLEGKTTLQNNHQHRHLVQSPLPLALPRPRFCKHFTFEEFVVGKPNAYAYAATYHLAKGELDQPLYLYSDTGLGKSHLSQAVGNFILNQQQNLRIFYLTTEEFTNEMVRALKTNYISEFKKKYRNECDVLILENIHFLSGKEKIQTELAYTLDILLEAKKKIIFTSLTPPQKIPSLKKELRSRMESGVFAVINPPDKETRFHILRKKAQKERIHVPERVIQHLAEKIEGDVRRLESALKNVVARAIVQKRPIDIELTEEVIAFFIEKHPPLDINTIKEIVCEHYRLSPAELISKSRKKQVVQPRKVAIYLAKSLLDISLTELGRHFHRHHATILSILNTIEKEINRHSTLAKEIAYLHEKIKKREGFSS
jgi:chromosomal replication initiator protein